MSTTSPSKAVSPCLLGLVSFLVKIVVGLCGGDTHGILALIAAARKDCAPQVLLPEEEKIIVEEVKSNGQMVIEEK